MRHRLRHLKPRRGETIHLIIDDTRIPKRGTKMFGVRKMWDHKQQRFVHGHIVVCAAILFRGVTLPWRFDLWLPKDCAGRSYHKTTEIAAQMIRAFEPPKGLKVRVLFDAFYLCPTVTKACETKGFTWFSVASRNRTIYEKRWTIEVLFKELRVHVGLGDYQVPSKDAIQRHLHLCGLAHMLLTHHRMDTVGDKAIKNQDTLSLPPMSERLTAPRNDVRRDQLRKLLGGTKHRKLFQRVQDYLQAA